MTTLYLALEISALLLVIILPLRGPKNIKKRKADAMELSEWAIDENGDLQSYIKKDEPDHHHHA